MFIEVQLIYSVELISAIQQSDFYTYFYIIFHNGLSQDIEQNSLCNAVGPCFLFVLYIVFYMLTSPPYLLPLGNQKSVLCVCDSVSALQTGSFVPCFRFHVSDVIWCLSFCDFLHLVWPSLIASMSLQLVSFHSFSWLSCIPSHIPVADPLQYLAKLIQYCKV